MIDALHRFGVGVADLTVLGSWPAAFRHPPASTKVSPVSRSIELSALSWIKRNLASSSSHALVIDLPWASLGRSGLAEVLSKKNGSVRVIGVDGPQDCDVGLDLVFVPSFYLDDSVTNLETRVVSGWDTYLLRNVVRRSSRPRKRSLLVAVGGADTDRLGEIWPARIRDLGEFNEVRWLRGPYAPAPRGVDDWSEFSDYLSPRNPTDLMTDVAYGLAVFGVTFFELCASGIPSVTYSPYGERTANQMRELERLGIGLVAASPEDAVDKLSLLANSTTRQLGRMRRFGRRKLRSYRGARFSAELVHELSKSQLQKI